MTIAQRAVAHQAHFLACYERGEAEYRRRHGDPLDVLYREGKILMADKIAARAVAGATSQSLHDPTAFLASRLRPHK